MENISKEMLSLPQTKRDTGMDEKSKPTHTKKRRKMRAD